MATAKITVLKFKEEKVTAVEMITNAENDELMRKLLFEKDTQYNGGGTRYIIEVNKLKKAMEKTGKTDDEILNIIKKILEQNGYRVELNIIDV